MKQNGGCFVEILEDYHNLSLNWVVAYGLGSLLSHVPTILRAITAVNLKFLSELDIFKDLCPHYLVIRLQEFMTVKLGCSGCDHPMSSSGVPCVVIC